MNSLLRAKLEEQVSLAIRLLYWGVGIFPLTTFDGRSWMPGQTFVARLSCLPLISLAPVSGVLSAKSVHATVSRSEFWSKIPQRNVEVFNRVGPTGDTIAQVTKHTRKALGLMDGPYNSLEECPGQHTPNTPKQLESQSHEARARRAAFSHANTDCRGRHVSNGWR